MQVIVLQVADVNNFGVLFHVLAVVDGLVKLTGVIIDCVITVGIMVVAFARSGAFFIHPDYNTVVLTKRRNTVRIIADDVRSAVALGNSTFRIFRAGSIDGGVASGAIDGNSDILRWATVFVVFAAANRRRKRTGDSIDRTAGDGDIRLAKIPMITTVSDACTVVRTNGCYSGVVRDRDGSIPALRGDLIAVVIAGTDAGTAVIPSRKDGGIAGNAHLTAAATTTANTGSVSTCVGMHIGVVFDLDVLSGSIFSTADPGSIPTPSGNLGIAGDGDVFTIPS